MTDTQYVLKDMSGVVYSTYSRPAFMDHTWYRKEVGLKTYYFHPAISGFEIAEWLADC